jgi:hypothetical protein
MTDNTNKELLELAAKAAGLRCIEYTNDYDGAMGLMQCDAVGRHTYTWNPFNDDGDALRLAVKLSLMLDEITQGYMAGHWVATHTNIESCYELAIPDPYAATRRAIVRAAAEIGRSMK